MLDIFMGQCARNAAYLDVSSLNEPVDDSQGGGEFDELEVVDLVVDPLADIEAPLLAAEAERMVGAFVSSLSPVLRCIVLRHFWEGQSQSDIAHDLGITRSAVCHALARVCRTGRVQLAALSPA